MDKDTFNFPATIILKASAGSGKTFELTKRFVQLLLFDLPFNRIENILAITFSNNSAIEMKKRIISLLKRLYFKDPAALRNIKDGLSNLTLDDNLISEYAGRILEDIFENYSQFQVRTIDSFMTAIYGSISIEFGHYGDIDILFDNDEMINYAYNLFLSELKSSTELEIFFEDIINKIQSNNFIWNPARDILKKLKDIHLFITKSTHRVIIEDEYRKIKKVEDEIKEILRKCIPYLPEEKRKNVEEIIANKELSPDYKSRLKDILTLKKDSPPMLKRLITEELKRCDARFIELIKGNYFAPYLFIYLKFIDILNRVNTKEGKISMDEISKRILDYINNTSVPDIYFILGEKIYHFLIDEFQDTSPIQWLNLKPLIENSLSQGGSLFVVGDMKQAIYQFRRADYRIMKNLIESKDIFPSSRKIIKELDINYRSCENIVTFTERFFKNLKDEDDILAGTNSGLLNFRQYVADENKSKGYVEISVFNKDEEDEPWKKKILEIVNDAIKRGFHYSDISILTHKNDNVNDIASFLNSAGIPVLPFSNLDIRERRIVKEIVSLLRFLDSPLDNLSFSEFITGYIMKENIRIKNKNIHENWTKTIENFLFRNRKKTLYKEFQQEFSELWEIYFNELFSLVGYLPLYDLISDIYRRFSLFEISQTEIAALIKLLDVANRFEMKRGNGLRMFLESYEVENENTDTTWNIENPVNIDAVNLLTVHKAKGLEFPLVISVIYSTKGVSPEYHVNEEEDRIRFYKIIQKDTERSEKLRDIYQQKKIDDKTSLLNTLYVSFTRAKKELYIVGVKGKNRDSIMDILSKNNLVDGAVNKKFHIKKRKKTETFAPIYFSKERSKMPKTVDEELNIEEKLRGELIHRILSNIEYISDNKDFEKTLEEAVKKALRQFRYYHDRFDELLHLTRRFILTDSFRMYFEKKDRMLIYREREFCNHTGRVIRPDRINIDGDIITVIDYKTGDRSREEDDIRQVLEYMDILREIFRPEKMNGAILYFDLLEKVTVENGK